MALIFKLEDVGVTYDKTPILEGLSFEVPAGERLAVMGPSGVGKSTFLRALGLMIGPDDPRLRGSITYWDRYGTARPFRELKGAAAEDIRCQDFGFALQSSYLLPHLSARDNVAIPLALRGIPYRERTEKADALLASAGLSHRSVAVPSDLSGGERQRVNVLRAIIHGPRVVFADEPVSWLDEDNKRYVLGLLDAWRSGELEGDDSAARTLVMACHDRSIANEWSDRILVFSAGGYVFEATGKSANE